MISAPPQACTHNCNGVTTDFPFNFRITAEGDLEVLHIRAGGDAERLVLNHDYTVLEPGPSGGTVRTAAAYPAGDRIMLWIDLPIIQPMDYVENDAFPAESHEAALDRLTLIAAQTRAEADRALHFPLGSGGAVLPDAHDRAGRFLAFDAQGDVIVTPAIADPIVIEQMDQAQVYFDRNADTLPRLVLDPAGLGSTPDPAIAKPGATDSSTVMLQDTIPLANAGVQRFWIGMNFKGQPAEGEQVPIDNRHSRFALGVTVVNEIDAEYDSAGDDNADPADGPFFPQQAGCLQLTATAAPGTSRAKVEALVVSAREAEGVAVGSKGVAVQAVTVRTTPGPAPDDPRQIDNADNDADGAEASTGQDGTNLGSFTLRLNGGTVNRLGDDGLLHPVFGGYRSWSAVLAGGRAGYFNGVVLGKRHHLDAGETDPEGVGGWGGVWGGRSFWHQGSFAAYAKEGCPGWLTVGHDGVPVGTNGTDAAARAPLDIEVDLAPAPAAWTGAVLSFNGDRLLAPRQPAIADAAAGQEVAKINAILGALRAHGLIGA